MDAARLGVAGEPVETGYLVDVNVAMGDLTELVASQSAAVS